jgi:hypothetical protein
VRDKNGEIYTVRYDAVKATLLNEFLREHHKVENLKNEFEAAVAQRQREIANFTTAFNTAVTIVNHLIQRESSMGE